MSHVFHPGHHELHGVTVVLDTTGGETWIGRFHSEDERGVHLLDVARHEVGAGGGAASREEFVRRSAKFGVRVDQKAVTLPKEIVASVKPLGEVG